MSDQQTQKKEEEKSSDNNLEEESQDQEEYNEDQEEGEGDEEEEKINAPSGPHFDFIDGFFYIMLAILKDALDTTWLLGMFVGGIIILFLYLKGVPAVGKAAIAMGVDMIPVLGLIPITILTAIVTILVTNHPKAVKKLGVAGEIAQKVIQRGK